MQRADRLREFVAEIWQWYATHKRALPWRDLAIADDTQRAYMILVSEVMLQQTQVSRVQVLFPRFLRQFPTIHDLAKASNRDVLIAWRGMGYNSRALRLRDAARMIVARYSLARCANEKTKKKKPKTSNEPTRQRTTKAGFPCTMAELTAIPGIGNYTAAAIRNFAFGIPTPCVDVNIERILRRVFGVKKRAGESAGEVLRVALDVPRYSLARSSKNKTSNQPTSQPANAQRRGAAQWHSALMDFGSLVCTKKKPLCSQCPLSQGICRSAFTADRATSQPVRQAQGRRATNQREPGRLVGGRFIPNRIIRGKIVDLLRDHPQGLTFEAIGRNICLDWSKEQRSCLRKILGGLCRDSLLRNTRGKYAIS